MECDLQEPGKFPSLDSCQKRFLWTYQHTDLALHPVVDRNQMPEETRICMYLESVIVTVLVMMNLSANTTSVDVPTAREIGSKRQV